MATKKKNNSRKALAVALGIMGVAGLSLASASQLNITPSTEVAMGSAVFAECDTAVGITYGYDAAYKINSVTITGIADACVGKPMQFSIVNNTTTGSPIIGAGTMSAWTTTVADNNSYKVTIASPVVPLTSDLGAATVIIG